MPSRGRFVVFIACILLLLAFLNLSANWKNGTLSQQAAEIFQSGDQTRAARHSTESLPIPEIPEAVSYLEAARSSAFHASKGHNLADAHGIKKTGQTDEVSISRSLPRQRYHVLMTSDGSVYTQWQSRVCYWWFERRKSEEPGSAAGGFTRLLHSGKADDFMQEIPTVVVDPLPVSDGGYMVLHRPYGILQWVQKYVDGVQEDFVLMLEPDHLLLRLPPLWATPSEAAAFPFSYMRAEDHAAVLTKYNVQKVPITSMAPIGSSPVQIHKAQLKAIAPLWYDLAMRFKQDNETAVAFGWIQEMYAYSVASSQLETGPVNYRLVPEFLLHPPWDETLLGPNGKDAYLLHYTYGQDCDEATGAPLYNKIGSWHFDKRAFENKYPPRDFPLPRKCRAVAMVRIVAMINEASRHLTPWGL